MARINAMLDAYKKGKQVVQVGTHQRSWDHFIEAKKFLDGGSLGTISHVVIVQPGSYARPKEAEQPVPAGLDWDMWSTRALAPLGTGRSSRPGSGSALVDAYGGGLVGDWGAHHVDVAHWFMNADGKVPLRRRRPARSSPCRMRIRRGAGHVTRFRLRSVDNFHHDVRNAEVQRPGLGTSSRTGACSSSAAGARCR